jgi:hypothetical protein
MTERRISLLALLVLACAAPAFAEDAKTLKKEGFDAAQAKNFELARQKLEASYALEQDPQVLYNLAIVQEQLGLLLAARTNFTKYLAQSKPGPADDKFRGATKAKLPTLEKSIPTLAIKAVGFPSTVVIELDQRALLGNELAAPFQIDPGPHVIVARRDTEVLARKEFKVERGAREEITLTAPPPKVEKQPVQPVIVKQPPKPIEKPPGGTLRSPLFWGATSLALIGGAAAYYFLYYSKTETTPGTLGRGVIDL